MLTRRKLLWLAKVIISNHHVNTVERGRVLWPIIRFVSQASHFSVFVSGKKQKMWFLRNLRARTSSAPLWFAADWEPPSVCHAPRGPIQSYAQGIQMFGLLHNIAKSGWLFGPVRLSEWNNSGTSGGTVDWKCRVRARSKSDTTKRRFMARLAAAYRWLTLHRKWEHTHFMSIELFPPKNFTVC